MKVAIVHEWLTTLGGSERVVMALHRLFPDAPVYVTVHDPAQLPDEYRALDVRPSFIQRLPGAKKRHQAFLPLMPLAAEQHDLRGYDVVISSQHAVSHGVITDADCLHLSYVHTPMRYAWDLTQEYQATLSPLKRALAAPLLSYLRAWDATASLRVDAFLANSRVVAERIGKHYRRPATVIHPPIRVAEFAPGPSEDHFLVVSRLVPYKRVDLAIEAANRTGAKLRIVGDGPLYRELKALAGPSVEFLGAMPDAAVREQYSRCKAFLFPAFEDFGITPLEAMASGKPVIAYGRGGALETVVDGITGLFFGEQSADSLVSALQRFEGIAFSSSAIRRHAGGYDEARFAERMGGFVETTYQAFKASGSALAPEAAVYGAVAPAGGPRHD